MSVRQTDMSSINAQKKVGDDTFEFQKEAGISRENTIARVADAVVMQKSKRVAYEYGKPEKTLPSPSASRPSSKVGKL